MSMVNTCESALKIVIYDKPKWLLGLSQKAKEMGGWCIPYRLVAHMSPGRKQAPNPMYFWKRNVETPYRPWILSGRCAARHTDGGAGLRCRKKRMPYCNGTDTGLNVTRHESGPTSDWSFIARKSVEPLK